MNALMSPRPAGSREKPSFSIPSIVAIGLVIVSYFFEGLDWVFAVGAIIFGIIGAVMALSPSVRGGIISILAIVLAVLSIIASIFQIIF